MEGNSSFLKKYKLQITDKKSSLLTRSLLWMSLGLVFIILVAWISSNNQAFFDFAIQASVGTNWIIVWLLSIALIFGLYFSLRSTEIPIIIPIILYALFAFYEGFFITTIIAFSGTGNIVKDLLLYLLIPAGIFGIMGVLGYFNIINFAKLLPFTLFSFIGLLILSLVLVFTDNWYVETTYLFISMAVFIIWIGFDLQMIGITQDAMVSSAVDKKMMNRISFMFGINLFIDFVNLLQIIIRLFSN